MVDQDVSLGEITRTVNRIETAINALTANVNTTNQLVAAHSIRLDTDSRKVDELDKKVDNLATRSAYISGGIGAVMTALNYFFLGKR